MRKKYEKNGILVIYGIFCKPLALHRVTAMVSRRESMLTQYVGMLQYQKVRKQAHCVGHIIKNA